MEYEVTVINGEGKWITVDIKASSIERARTHAFAIFDGEPMRVWHKDRLVWFAPGAEMEA